MTLATPALDPIVATDLAAAAGPHLPVEGPLEPVPVDTPEGVLAGPDSTAVAVRVAGSATGTVALLVAAPLAELLLRGPLGDVDAATALEPALTSTVEALGAALGAGLQQEACRAIDGTVAVDLAGSAALTVALVAGGEHVASIVVALDPPAEAGPEAEVPAPREVQPEFRPLGGVSTDPRRLALLHQVPMAVTVQLGTTRMTVRELLALTPGSIVELDRAAGSPVDVLVNGTLIARGEVVVVDEEYAVRISEIVNPSAERSDES